MVSISQILDPTARDSKLRAYAYVQARFIHGARSALDCLRPFVIAAISNFDGEAYDPEVIQGYLSETYGLKLPLYTITEMERDLENQGAIVRKKISHARYCSTLVAQPAGSEEINFSIDDIDYVEQRLAKFASDSGSPKPLASSNWGEALVQFFQPEGNSVSVQPKKVGGTLVTDPQYFDNKIIGEFALSVEASDKRAFESLEKIYYGVLVKEFLTTIEKTGDKAGYNKLEIIYDTTVLLRLLGTSGSKLRVATLEMHETLQGLGCRTYYYNHTYTEALNSLEYVASADAFQNPINAETQGALDNREVTIPQIAILANSLDARLGQLGITEYPVTYEDRSQDQFNIDEEAFEKALKRTGRPSFQRGAEKFDAQSLSLTVRRRAGKLPRDVANAGVVFVTHNALVNRVARRFMIEEHNYNPRVVPPMLTLGQMTTAAWLANEIVYDPVRISKELIANCYRASLPTDGWTTEYWKALKSVDPDIAEKSAADLIHHNWVRTIALKETRGHASLLRIFDMRSALEEAERQAGRLAKEAEERGKGEGKRTAAQEYELRASVKARHFARSLTRYIEWAAILVCGVFILASINLIQFSVPWLKMVTQGVAAIGALWSLVELFEMNKRFGLSLPSVFRWVEELIYRLVRSLQKTMTE